MKTRRSKRQRQRRKSQKQRGGNHNIREHVSRLGLWLIQLDMVRSKTDSECSADPGLCIYTKDECCTILSTDLPTLLIGVNSDFYVKIFNDYMKKADAISLNIFYYFLIKVVEDIAVRQSKNITSVLPLTGGNGTLNTASVFFSRLSTASSVLGTMAGIVVGDGSVTYGFACTAGVCAILSTVTKRANNYREGKNITLGQTVTNARNIMTHGAVIPGLKDAALLANISWSVGAGVGTILGIEELKSHIRNYKPGTPLLKD